MRASQAINYLLARPEPAAPAADEPSAPPPQSVRSHLSRFRSTEGRGVFTTPPAIRSAIYGSPSRAASSDRLGVRGRPSLGTMASNKRANTAAAEFLLQASEFGSPRSVKSSFSPRAVHSSVDVIDREEAVDDAASDDQVDYEGLENVRACCDGKHDVGA